MERNMAVEELTEREMDVVMTVFKSYETWAQKLDTFR